MYLDSSNTVPRLRRPAEQTLSLSQKTAKVVTPKSDSILPSITRRSLIYVAQHYLGLEVEERESLL